jgi:hypothetical protein
MYKPKPQFIGNWKEKFGEEYEVPNEITDILPDQSHSNSLCPSFLIGHTKTNAEITLWVEHPDPRERVKGVPVDMREYACQQHRFHFMRCCETGETDCLVETDDLELAMKYVKSYLKYLGKNQQGTIAQPKCKCGNRSMASMGIDIICDQCHTKCGKVQ